MLMHVRSTVVTGKESRKKTFSGEAEIPLRNLSVLYVSKNQQLILLFPLKTFIDETIIVEPRF